MFARSRRKPPASPASGARNETIATMSVQVEKRVNSRSAMPAGEQPRGEIREDHDTEQRRPAFQ